jgi:hypothetical protein
MALLTVEVLSWPENDPRVTAMRVASRFAHATQTPRRVQARFERVSREFSDDKALREYLKEHPGADKSLHKVVKPEAHEGPGDEKGHDKGHGDEHGEAAPKKSWKERFKGLSDKAKAFVKTAPAAVKSFIQDDAFRRTALMAAHKSLEEAPKKMVRKLVDTAKEEVHEFKAAGQGIKAVLSGKKMDKHQKHAFKKVAFHVGLTVAATALTAAGGPLVAAAAFGKSMAKHVAMKAASNALSHLHILQEFGHVGHGIAEILEKFAADQSKKAPVDHEEAMMKLIIAAVAKEIEKLDDHSTIDGALNAMGDD